MLPLLFCIVDLRWKFGVSAVSDSAAGMLNVSTNCVPVHHKLLMLYVVVFYFLTLNFKIKRCLNKEIKLNWDVLSVVFNKNEMKMKIKIPEQSLNNNCVITTVKQKQLVYYAQNRILTKSVKAAQQSPNDAPQWLFARSEIKKKEDVSTSQVYNSPQKKSNASYV